MAVIMVDQAEGGQCQRKCLGHCSKKCPKHPQCRKRCIRRCFGYCLGDEPQQMALDDESDPLVILPNNYNDY
uniref:Equinin B n=1 Tax=Actinia equina TaxID=6106 RepID=EQB_ACTEQ